MAGLKANCCKRVTLGNLGNYRSVGEGVCELKIDYGAGYRVYFGQVGLGNDCDRQWVKDFGASDKSQAVYELAAWLDSLGLQLTVTVK